MAIQKITANIITAVSNTSISGNIVATQITSVANTQITGLITGTQLANTAVTAGVYGGTSNVASITVDAQGRITSVANATITTSNSGGGGQVFTSSGSFIIPTSVTKLKVTCVSGGGAGGQAIDMNRNAGGGGGGGGMAIKFLTGLTPGANATVTVGAGGATFSAAGGNSTFVIANTTLCAATGGRGGAAGNQGRTGGAGGTGTVYDLRLTGTTGGTGTQDCGGSSVGGAAGILYAFYPDYAKGSDGSTLNANSGFVLIEW